VANKELNLVKVVSAKIVSTTAIIKVIKFNKKQQQLDLHFAIVVDVKQ
jgi:hypothetical protein